MNYKALILAAAVGFFGTSVVKAGEKIDQKDEGVISKLYRCKDRGVDFAYTHKAMVAAVTLLLAIVPMVNHITNGKDFKNCDELDSFNDAVETLQANPTSLEGYKNLLSAVVQRLKCAIRSVTGHSGYDIVVKKETITHPDGSETNNESKQKIAPTKLCKYIMDVAKIPKVLVNYVMLLVFVKELANVIDTGDHLSLADTKYAPDFTK